jgi:cellulose synthase/poly-beta-1,6-N-acetylglucosamine synthase-like glycosyltransferase
MIFLQVIFWTAIFLICYTYLLFPSLLHLLALRRKPGERLDRDEHLLPAPGGLPFLSVIIAAFNEEGVIEAKIRSVLEADYPADRLEVLVGSDASTDRTNEILTGMKERHPLIRVSLFDRRTGKPGVVNRLAALSRGEILVITDANVMIESNTFMELAGSFRHPDIGLVDTRMINTGLKIDGISQQERFYINREVRIKHHESLLWGAMMGPFGGCYAVRKSVYQPVPDHFLVDDFYVNMAVLKKGFLCISNVNALVYEDVSNDLREEFRRKKRISAGNFQNLARFGSMLFSRRAGIAFCFLSHKVIRWTVPFLVLVTLGSSIALGMDDPLYLSLAMVQAVILLLPVIDYFLRKFKIHHIPLRFVSHFVLMNLALLAGFIRYIGGIKSNVWQPTRRNQD